MAEKFELEPGKWIERYADLLYNYTYARVNRSDVAEDLVQDTFFSALKGQDSFLHNASEKTWLIAILKRKIIDHYRKKSTQNELNVLDREPRGASLDHFFGGGTDGHWTDKSAPHNWNTEAEAKVESSEFQTVLSGCLGKLPERWAAAFTLKNIDDLDTEEICKELGIAPSNYWVIMHRAKLQLRECMEKNWFGK